MDKITTAATQPAPGPSSAPPEEADACLEEDALDDVVDDAADDAEDDEDEPGSSQVGLHICSKTLTQSL